jgi:hypothetical protein
MSFFKHQAMATERLSFPPINVLIYFPGWETSFAASSAVVPSVTDSPILMNIGRNSFKET